MKTLHEKVVSKIAFGKEDDCWPWTGAFKAFGYGYLRVPAMNAKGWQDVPSHRAAYTVFHGEIPEGLFVLHSCDNRACCNPKHLRAGTTQDNAWDMVSRDRGNLKAILTDLDVLNIRKRKAAGELASSLAVEYGVAEPTIWSIHYRKSWKRI